MTAVAEFNARAQALCNLKAHGFAEDKTTLDLLEGLLMAEQHLNDAVKARGEAVLDDYTQRPAYVRAAYDFMIAVSLRRISDASSLSTLIDKKIAADRKNNK